MDFAPLAHLCAADDGPIRGGAAEKAEAVATAVATAVGTMEVTLPEEVLAVAVVMNPLRTSPT